MESSNKEVLSDTEGVVSDSNCDTVVGDNSNSNGASRATSTCGGSTFQYRVRKSLTVELG